ncbi:MAG: NAD(P)-dependent oxidoreductase [Phycisphaerae bacterium]
MKILVGCSLPESALQELRSLGTEVLYEPDLTTERMEKLVRDVAVLIVCRTRVSPEVIAAGKELQMIVRAGTDTANIAVEEASTQGIFVSNCPYKDAVAIAELIFGLLLALDRRVLENVAAFQKGVLDQPRAIDALGLEGRRLGVLGFGPVEQEIVKRARAFEMKLLAWSPTLTPELAAASQVEFCAWPRELARQSEMVTVYAPQQETGEVLVDAEFLENLRDGAYLVYVGHPAALDQTALAETARARHLRVAYDISAPQLVSSDTGRFRSSLQALPGVIGTHQLADRTRQAYEATAAEVVRVIREFLVAGEVVNCVNLMEHSPATWQLVLRLRDTVGVLASIMEHIRTDGINVEEVSSRVFTGAQAGFCSVALDERPSAEALNAIRELDGVLHLELRALV